jgi:hypothetical protein
LQQLSLVSAFLYGLSIGFIGKCILLNHALH